MREAVRVNTCYKSALDSLEAVNENVITVNFRSQAGHETQITKLAKKGIMLSILVHFQ
jgi:hypothetical protein